MAITEHFGAPQPLRDILATLTSCPNRWLHIPLGTTVVDLTTLCAPRLTDTRELSEGEAEELEVLARDIGLQPFLQTDDLSGIAANLRQQCPTYSPSQLVAAINHYWTRDAFIEVGR